MSELDPENGRCKRGKARYNISENSLSIELPEIRGMTSTIDGGHTCPACASMDAVIPAATTEPLGDPASVLPPGRSAAPLGPGSRHLGSREVKPGDLLYGIEDTPPWYLCILLGIQHSMTCFGGNLTVALVVTPAMCVFDNRSVSEILSTIFFVSGLVTFLQSAVGNRLPVIQGAPFSFLVPTFAILNLPQWKCPSVSDATGQGFDGTWNRTLTEQVAYTTASPNQTDSNSSSVSPSHDPDLWKSRMREVQGAIILSSMFEIVLGLSGLVGVLLRYIGPLAIAPTISLVGLSLFTAAAEFASKNWYIALTTSILILVFSQYMRKVNIPCYIPIDRKNCSVIRYPLFSLFPVVLAIVVSSILCMILTVTNAIPNDRSHWSYSARTDVKIMVVKEASWFRFPYPCQWGVPTFSVGAVFGMLAGVLAGTIESIGDYFACARLSGAPPPPIHAVNRGVFIEGVGCVLAGLWGSGSGTTSYSENVGAIGITKVGSRRVIQVEALIMMICGVLGKVGALFVTIPDPVIGGVFLVMFGIIAAVGVSNLQFVDLNSTRNLSIFGFSVFFGLAFPFWLSNDENKAKVKTGSDIADQIICVLLSTSMFVGGLIGFFLDNTVPGTEKERGLSEWRAHLKGDTDEKDTAAEKMRQTMQCYDLPFGMKWIRRWTLFKYVPLCPTFLLDAKSGLDLDQSTVRTRKTSIGVELQRRASVVLQI